MDATWTSASSRRSRVLRCLLSHSESQSISSRESLGWTGAEHSLHQLRRVASTPPPCTCFAPSRARRYSHPRFAAVSMPLARSLRARRSLADARAPALLAGVSPPPVLAARRWLRTLPLADALALGSLPPVFADTPPRTPCTAFAPSRARRSLSRGTPCEIPSLPLAVHALLPLPAPRRGVDVSRSLPLDAALPATAETFLELHFQRFALGSGKKRL